MEKIERLTVRRGAGRSAEEGEEYAWRENEYDGLAAVDSAGEISADREYRDAARDSSRGGRHHLGVRAA